MRVDHRGNAGGRVTVIRILQINLEVIHLQTPQVSRVPTGGVQTGERVDRGLPHVTPGF